VGATLTVDGGVAFSCYNCRLWLWVPARRFD